MVTTSVTTNVTTMIEKSIREVKTQLSQLIKDGQSIAIRRHGKLVAYLNPVRDKSQYSANFSQTRPQSEEEVVLLEE